MSDPHLNIFHAYRGSSSSDVARDRQLEDNLTRALAITLQSVHTTSAQAPLLQILGVPTAQLDEPFQCRLQVDQEDLAWPQTQARQLLVLHGGSELTTSNHAEDALRGRADAVIANPSFMLAIESKLSAQVTQAQLDRHRATLGISDARIRTLSWNRLARIVRVIGNDVGLPAVARFVLEQFEEYLRMNGFGGLTEEHLSYFARQREHRDDLVKEGIRRALEGLMPELAEAWGTDWQPEKPGNIHRDSESAWAKLSPRGEKNVPHLSVSIDPAGLDLFGNIENNKPYKKFQDAWHQNSAGLIAIVRQLGELWPPSDHRRSWRFRVVRRIPIQAQHHHHWPLVDMTATGFATFSDERLVWFINEVTRRPEGESVPQIMFVRTLPAAKILGDVNLAKQLATHAAELEPFFSWLGEPVR